MSKEQPLFVETASRLAHRLCMSAVWAGNQCSWIGLKPAQVTGGYRHVEQPLGPDLYSGSAGNLFFLSRLFRVTGEKNLLLTAEGAAHYALARLEEIPLSLRMGFYAGWSGLAFAFIELGESTNRRGWLTKGLQILKRLARIDLNTQTSEVFFGMAGAISALLNIYTRHADPWILEFTCRLGDRLLMLARQRDIGWSWEAFGAFNHLHRDDLTGFAHGVSGIAWALLELYAVTGDERYRHAGEEGLRYESHWYRSAAENWLDLRYFPGPDGDQNNGKVCQIQWCHGAVGIGLTRLRAFQLLQRPQYREDAEAAIRTTLRDIERFPHNWQPNYSLCHGLAGNAEILLEGSLILANDSWRLAAEQVGWQGIELYEEGGKPWPSALNAQEIPGLMSGIAGTAYFYLRLYDPMKTPSIVLVTSGRASNA